MKSMLKAGSFLVGKHFPIISLLSTFVPVPFENIQSPLKTQKPYLSGIDVGKILDYIFSFESLALQLFHTKPLLSLTSVSVPYISFLLLLIYLFLIFSNYTFVGLGGSSLFNTFKKWDCKVMNSYFQSCHKR